ncbi:unnamed protein product [Caenorhabditis bovis]|uniref:G-protein coupled receptors family 1 profile domain-containing protein n=1 Tax=Caenorhabditis bovis TaxID=2654633 RepID=A0A8S1F9Z9_9PELO|nr:unnamed protein product [Caenorhabditis bovis]
MRAGNLLGQRIAEAVHRRGITRVELDAIARKCKSLECVLRAIMQTDTMENLDNCSYRYPETDPVTPYALWIDGPCTCVAALLSLVGARYAIKFLCRAGLNKELTAALFSLCAIDSLLMICVFLFYGIEASSILILDKNIMQDFQTFTYNLHGVASSLTTSSTILVVYITFLRFMVVMRPLRYANGMNQHHKRAESGNRKRKSINSAIDEPLPRGVFNKSSLKRNFNTKEFIRPFYIPFLLIAISFAIHIPTYFEFVLAECMNFESSGNSKYIISTAFRENTTYKTIKAIQMTLTQTIGPVSIILILSLLTEYRVHMSLKARRKLFESQQRSREVVMSEEIKERVSRTLAIFIAIKFLIFRTGPIFFDVYESIYGIENWSVTMSVMVRVSDFGIVLNTATNCLAYFGKKRWIEKRLRLRLLKKEEKRTAKAASTTASTRSCSVRKTLSDNGLPHPLKAEQTPLVDKELIQIV